MGEAPAEPEPNGVELASGKVAELVKSFEHVNEILQGLLILGSFGE